MVRYWQGMANVPTCEAGGSFDSGEVIDTGGEESYNLVGFALVE